MDDPFIVVNIVAIILSPIIAVFITQRLHDRAKKREDKLYIFKILMANRHMGWNGRDCVYALNIIDIVFSGSAKVREQWALFHEYMGRPPETISIKTSTIKRTELLEVMAEDLGYKGKITWVTVQSSYIPKGYTDYLESEARIHEAQSKIANLVDVVTNALNSPTLGKDILKGLFAEILNALGDVVNTSPPNLKDPDDSTAETDVEDAK